MAWFKLAKPAFIVGNFVRGFLHGSLDEVVETFKDPSSSKERVESTERSSKTQYNSSIKSAI